MQARFWVPHPQMQEASYYLRSVFVRAVAQREKDASWQLLSVLYNLDSALPPAFSRVWDEGTSDAQKRVRELERWAEKRAEPLPDGELALIMPTVERLHAWLHDRARAIKELDNIFTNDPSMLLVLARAADITRSISEQRGRQRKAMPVPVLIQGPTGAGKELLAHALHELSKRYYSNESEFGPVNCGGLPTELIESELFGHKKGAFTGANQERRGVITTYGTGTVFLDEIGDTPAEVQVRLLRFLNDGEVRQVGADKPKKAFPWVICATHRDLDGYVKEGKFREDLLFRLQGYRFLLPALRERSEDILPVLEKCVARHAGLENVSLKMSVQSRMALTSYSWPGNLRELDRLAYNVAITSSSQFWALEFGDLPREVQKNYLMLRPVAAQIVDLYKDKRPEHPDASIQVRNALVEQYRQQLRSGHQKSLLPSILVLRFLESSMFASLVDEKTASQAVDWVRYRYDETIRRLVENLEHLLAEVDGMPTEERQTIATAFNEEDLPSWLRQLVKVGEELALRPERLELVHSLLNWLDSLSPALRSTFESAGASIIRTVLEELDEEAEVDDTSSDATDVEPPDRMTHKWKEVRGDPELFRHYLKHHRTAIAMGDAFGISDRTVRARAKKLGVELQHGGPR